MNISIVIPNYNGEELLKKNLPKVIDAIKSYKKGKIEIIISDDASADKSVKVIDEFIKEIKEKQIVGKKSVITDRNEGGFSKNVSRGIRLVTGDVIVLLNNDVSPHKNFLDPLLKHFEDEKVFGVGCMDESVENNNEIVLRGRGLGKWQRGFLMHRLGPVDKANTLWISCGSGAFRKTIWDKIGGLNELYNPFYWEDVDLSYRAVKSGYSIVFEPRSKIIHTHEEGAIKKNFSEYNKIKIVFRNQFTFIWINITDKDLLFSHLIWLPYHVTKALFRGDKAFFWGLWHALIRLPQILNYKSKMKRMFVNSDKEVISKATG